MKNIAVFGSTGSIGRQALEVAAAQRDRINITVLAAHASDRLLEEQINQFNPDIAVLSDRDAAGRLVSRYRGGTRILAGDDGLLEAAEYGRADIMLAAMVGFAGLRPTLTALDKGRDIALANKETLVAAGGLIMPKVRERGVRLLPVDSEHSAIFQALNGEPRAGVGKILLTASGGPFRGRQKKDLAAVTLADCLKHPNWSMGRKVTIDSSTLANKGLEVIEAHWLFDIAYDNIKVLVHPESIVHSMVEYVDGSVIAQLGPPDMRLPIQYAFSWPERWAADFPKADFAKLGSLTFAEPDLTTFPALALAFAAGRRGGTLPCVYNGANEQAVHDFIEGKIRYLDIPSAIEYALIHHSPTADPNLADIMAADAAARELAGNFADKINGRTYSC